jgi:hypothetical protein
MNRMSRFSLSVTAGTLLLAAGCEHPPTTPDALVQAPASGSLSMQKHTLCHLDGTGEYVQITIADAAYDTHMAHGDLPVGANGECGVLMSRLVLHVSDVGPHPWGIWIASTEEVCEKGETCTYDFEPGTSVHLDDGGDFYNFEEEGQLICESQWGCTLVMDTHREIFAYQR